MKKQFSDSNMSNLERAFELELESFDQDNEWEQNSDNEFELDDELDDEFEFESDNNYELSDNDNESGDYAERLFELSQREFESETEADAALSSILNEMEREFFWGSIKKWWKKGKKGLFGRLIKKGLSFAKNKIPGMKALDVVSQLAKGNLKGALGSLAKSALPIASSFIPGASAVLPALQSLGFGGAGEPEKEREAWDNFVNLARESYDNLAANLTENIENPVVANRVAAEALKAGLQKMRNSSAAVSAGGRGSNQGRRVIHVRRGEVIVLKVT